MKKKAKVKQTEIGKIPKQWNIKTLNEISEDVSYGYTASANSEPVGPKFLRITDIVPYFIDWNSVPFCSINDENYKKYRLEQGDLVIARTGATTGFNALIKEKKDCVFASYLIRFKLRQKMVDPLYVGYVMKSTAWKSFVNGIIGGSAQPGANANQFGTFKLPVPPLGEQQSIVKILSDLDSKIELNNEMNKTLEEIGAALFKHWFIDFEFPNGKGKPYKSSGEKMGYNEELEKEIPEGWKADTLSEVSNITMGQSPPGETYNEQEEGIQFYQGIADFGFRFPTPRVYCTAPTRFANKGDILLSVRAPVGSLNLAPTKCAIGRGLAAIAPKQRHYGFLYYSLKNSQKWEIFEAEGTVYGSATKNDIANFSVLMPPTQLVDQFNSTIESMDKKIGKNIEQSLGLSQIRDLLLPKLRSGQIRAKVA